MNRYLSAGMMVVAAVLLGGACQTASAQDGIEILTRGPVHEAFAEPVTLQGQEPFRINRQPPPPINEMPPTEKPEGDNVVWVPGYWSWDTDLNDFVWVSGCWRVVPLNCAWVPGYWVQADNQFEWVPGFWQSVSAQDIEYLPTPPDSLEAGPPGPPPSADVIWEPGCWLRQGDGYAWQPGYWMNVRPDWVWVPPHYLRTPRGYVFVDGYWDYPLSHRGVLFLPIRCPARLYEAGNFYFSPTITLDFAGARGNLFCNPAWQHYYFGDYYDAQYARAGFYPWYEAREHHEWYDPLFTYQQWKHRNEPTWADGLRTQYEHRRNDRTARPARTYAELQTQVNRLPEAQRNGISFARPLSQVVSAKTSLFHFETLNDQRRTAIATQAKDVHNYKNQRQKWEAPVNVPMVSHPVTPVTPAHPVTPTPEHPVTPMGPVHTVTPTPAHPVTPAHPTTPPVVLSNVKPHTVPIPASPIYNRTPANEKGTVAPPPRPTTPKVDPTVQPRGHASETPARSVTPATPAGAKDPKDTKDPHARQ